MNLLQLPLVIHSPELEQNNRLSRTAINLLRIRRRLLTEHLAQLVGEESLDPVVEEGEGGLVVGYELGRLSDPLQSL